MTFAGADPATARQRLHGLLDLLRSGRLSVDAFCSQFETTYNLEFDKRELTLAEATAFAMLFEKVIWYSPFPEERKAIPHDLGEAEIRNQCTDGPPGPVPTRRARAARRRRSAEPHPARGVGRVRQRRRVYDAACGAGSACTDAASVSASAQGELRWASAHARGVKRSGAAATSSGGARRTASR
jgi:hypothetical protein